MKIIKSILTLSAIAAISISSANAQVSNGRATTAAPTYDEGNIAPFSMDLTGGLRVNCVTGCTGGGGGGDVNITEVGGVPVTNLPVDITTPIPAGTNVIGDVGINGSLPAGTNNIGDVDVTFLPALPAGTNNIGDVDIVTMPSIPTGSNTIGNVGVTSLPALPTGTNVIGEVLVAPPNTQNSKYIFGASTNANYFQTGSSWLVGMQIYNNTSDPFYFKIYDKGSAPVCGTDTPVAVHLVPAGTGGGGTNIPLPFGQHFQNGFAFCTTTGIADGNTTALPTANSGVVNVQLMD